MNQTVSLLQSKSFRPMYVFTMLGALLVFTLLLLAMVLKTQQGNEAIVAILNTAVGTELALLGVVVNYEFGGAKGREQQNRATDQTEVKV